MQPKQLIGVFFNKTDGCSYSSQFCIGIFDDIDQAKSAAEQAYKDDWPLRDNEHLEWDDMTCYRVWATGNKQEYEDITLEFIEINKIR